MPQKLKQSSIADHCNPISDQGSLSLPDENIIKKPSYRNQSM